MVHSFGLCTVSPIFGVEIAVRTGQRELEPSLSEFLRIAHSCRRGPMDHRDRQRRDEHRRMR